MPTFRYRAYGPQGEFAEGSIDAASQEAASGMLWAQGLTPFQMRAVAAAGRKWWQRELFAGEGGSRAHLVPFTRDLATLIAAEIPLDDALRIVGDQANSGGLRAIA